jgi:hypothetical protein
MTEVTDSQIDEAILSELGPRSLKTARIVVRVGERFHEADQAFRIGVLIEAGRVRLFGRLADWRSSELALMPPDA